MDSIRCNSNKEKIAEKSDTVLPIFFFFFFSLHTLHVLNFIFCFVFSEAITLGTLRVPVEPQFLFLSSAFYLHLRAA